MSIDLRFGLHPYHRAGSLAAHAAVRIDQTLKKGGIEFQQKKTWKFESFTYLVPSEPMQAAVT